MSREKKARRIFNKEFKEEACRLVKEEEQGIRVTAKNLGLNEAMSEIKYAFIKNHLFEFPLSLMCQVLMASKSGFYSWNNSNRLSREAKKNTLS